MQDNPIDPLTIMVSSTVYGIEDLLDQIFATLRGYGYRVWMSHKGTVPVDPGKTAFSNCLRAVDQCNLFLGIITGSYGSGIGPNKKSITHREIIRAIRRSKHRWFLVHHDVTVARQLLKQFRFRLDGKPKKVMFRRTSVLDDLRALEVYDRATRQALPLAQRTGNWVQEYVTADDALRFVQTQFEDQGRIRQMLAQ